MDRAVDLTNVRIDDLLSTFDSVANDAMKDHEKRFQERVRSVRDACNALDNSASKFEVAVRNAWGTMDKSASEYGTRMAQTIEESARRLSREQTSSSYQDTEKFHKDSIEALNTIIKTVRKYVPKLRRGLRVEMAALNVNLGKLETAVKSTGLALDQSPGNRVEMTRREILRLKEAHAELGKIRSEQVEANEALDANASKEREAAADAEQLSTNPMLRELVRYEDALRIKGEEIGQSLQPIIKPLTKLERNESMSNTQTVDLGTLRNLVDRPVETVATGQPFAVVQLLTRLDEALRHGQLEIEERRRRKAEETIEQSKDGMIERLREEYLTIQANVQETLRQMKVTGLLDRKNELELRQAALGEEKERLMSRTAELRRRVESATKDLVKQKESIEQQIKRVADKSLEIQIE